MRKSVLEPLNGSPSPTITTVAFDSFQRPPLLSLNTPCTLFPQRLALILSGRASLPHVILVLNIKSREIFFWSPLAHWLCPYSWTSSILPRHLLHFSFDHPLMFHPGPGIHPIAPELAPQCPVSRHFSLNQSLRCYVGNTNLPHFGLKILLQFT